MSLLTKFVQKFKNIETQYERKLNPQFHTIIRIDGYKFHRYTKKYFTFPFDLRIPLALYYTAKYIVEKLSKVIVFFYIQSDEISLYIPPSNYFIDIKGWQDIPKVYNGRIQKIISLLPSFTTGKFNEIIVKLTNDNKLLNYQQIFNSKFRFNKLRFNWEIPDEPAYFDGRVFQLETLDDVKDYFTWRRIDAIRNSKNQFAYGFMSYKETLNMSSNERIQIVYEKFGYDYTKLPRLFKVGLPICIDKDFKEKFDFKFIYSNPDYLDILMEID